MAASTEVVVIDITKKNFRELWPALLFAVQNSSFVAIDLELSGLGERKQLTASSVDERFKALSRTAQSRSVVSMGLSCFRQEPSSRDSFQRVFKAQTFNIFLLCNSEYVVESQSLQFLVNHGFDFNKQYSLGVPYSKGEQETSGKMLTIRRLLLEIVSAQKPLVVHNGLIDLVFLYQNFYAQLPNLLQTFIADLCDMFPRGIFDTKYISEFHVREHFSFLEYLFKKCQYKNEALREANETCLLVKEGSSSVRQMVVDQHDVACTLPDLKLTQSILELLPNLCNSFKTRGYCCQKDSCTKIHSVDLMIIGENATQGSRKRNRRRKRKLGAEEENTRTDNKKSYCDGSRKQCKPDSVEEKNSNTNDLASSSSKEDDLIGKVVNEQLELPRMNGHRAGFDAFMTGYCFAFYQLACQQEDIEGSRNKVYLTAKDLPLNIMKSHFAKTSSRHEKIMAVLKPG